MTIYPAPKPAPRVSLSDKARTPVARVNAKRKQKRFSENFGGKDYLAYVHSLPCDVCGLTGFTEAAHLTSRGAGGKAEEIAPLCGIHWRALGGAESFAKVLGCHEKYDRHLESFRAHEPRLRKLARERYKAFQELIKETAK